VSIRSTTRLLGLGLCATLGCTMLNPAFNERDDDPGETDLAEGEATDGDGDPSTGDGDPSTGDGDPSTGDGDGDGDPMCEAPLEYTDCDLTDSQALTSDPFAALGLGCPGGPVKSIAITEANLFAQDPTSWRVARYFGSALGPNAGGRLWAPRHSVDVPSGSPDLPPIAPNTSAAILILSTGKLSELEPDGGLVMTLGSQAASGANANPDSTEFPAPISPLQGSNDGEGGTPFVNCDGVNDCSDSLHGQWAAGQTSLFDMLWLRFHMPVPTGVHGYMFDFAFFSSEYPGFINTDYNDTFVAWSISESYTGNLTFINQTPMNTASLHEAGGFEHTGLDPALAGTGFEGHGGTGWLLARGPVVPGEVVDVTLFLTDVGDAQYASVVLLDNFRWDCLGCANQDCGFTP
jgi:hypothetical protein